MSDKHTHKFRSRWIDNDTIAELRDMRGLESNAEYLRALVRQDAQRHNVEIGPEP
jgi:hypothetical protein